MKKIYFIILFLLSFLFISKVNASTIPQLVGTIDKCYLANNYLYDDPSDLAKIYIYRVTPSESYSFVYEQGIRLRIMSSPASSPTNGSPYCGNYMSPRSSILYTNSPVTDYEYTISSDYEYIYMYFGYDQGRTGSIHWVSDEPTIPHITISNHDFYLFYDFNTIINFDILSDYDFTSFTDYQKLIVCLLFNLFYILFIFFILYILLKALNKLLSWVFY